MGKGRDKRKRIEKKRQAVIVPKAAANPDDSPSANPEALVRAPLRPKPHLRSGAVEAPEPEEAEEIMIKSPIRLR